MMSALCRVGREPMGCSKRQHPESQRGGALKLARMTERMSFPNSQARTWALGAELGVDRTGMAFRDKYRFGIAGARKFVPSLASRNFIRSGKYESMELRQV